MIGFVRWFFLIDGMIWKIFVIGFVICGIVICFFLVKLKKFFYFFYGGKKVVVLVRIVVKFKKWVENLESNELLVVGGEDMKMFVC